MDICKSNVKVAIKKRNAYIPNLNLIFNYEYILGSLFKKMLCIFDDSVFYLLFYPLFYVIGMRFM